MALTSRVSDKRRVEGGYRMKVTVSSAKPLDIGSVFAEKKAAARALVEAGVISDMTDFMTILQIERATINSKEGVGDAGRIGLFEKVVYDITVED